MAATRSERRRARRRGVSRELPWLLAGLGALACRDARAQSSVDARFLYYKELDGRTQVLDPLLLVHQDLGEAWGLLDLLLGYDSISGASPSGAYPTSDVTTSASGQLVEAGTVPTAEYSDTRKAASLGYSRRFGAHLPRVDLSFSKENDYASKSVGLSDSWTLLDGRGTLHLGASISRDTVSPVGTSLDLDKKSDAFALGWTWILGPRDLFDVSASLTKLSGYLDDPYKVVPVGTLPAPTNVPDHRPDSRTRWAVVGKYGHYYPWRAALKAQYRFYWDDWSVRSHTLELGYEQRLGSRWVVSPVARYHDQSAASFYGSLFPAPQTHLSADYRLSPMHSVLGGLTVSYRVDGSFSVNLGGTYQWQVGRDRVTPIPVAGSPATGLSVSAADLDTVAATAGFTFTY